MKVSPLLLSTGILSTLLFLGEEVHSHGIEVRSCISTSGNLRIFIEHWHGALSSPSQAGTMDIEEISHVSGSPVTFTLEPIGLVNNVDIEIGGILPGCASGSSIRNSVCTDKGFQGEDDWVYYDFPTKCFEPVEYTLIAGNTIYLTEGCDDLYPTNIKATFEDVSAPLITINGSPCDDSTSGSTIVTANKEDTCTEGGTVPV